MFRRRMSIVMVRTIAIKAEKSKTDHMSRLRIQEAGFELQTRFEEVRGIAADTG